MADKHTVEQRIAHFLRLAEDASATQAERDLASSQAERLMLKHAIDLASLDVHADQRRVEPVVSRHVSFPGTYAPNRIYGGYLIATEGLKLTAYQGRGPGHVDQGLIIVGHESDVDEAERLIRSIDLQAAVATAEYARLNASPWNDASATKTRKKSFLEGFFMGARSRIRDSRVQVIREAEAENPGTELVLVDRKAEADAWFRANGPKLRTTRSTARRNGSDRSAGVGAGSNANIGGGAAIGAGRRAIGR